MRGKAGKGKACAGLLLAAMMWLSACAGSAPQASSAQESSSEPAPSQVSSPVQASSMPAEVEEEQALFDVTQTAAYQNAEPWQHAYYQICLEEGAEGCHLLYPDEGPPVLAIYYYNDELEVTKYKCWRYDGEQAVLFFEDSFTGQERYPFRWTTLYVNRASGNIIINKELDDWYEVVDGEKVLLSSTEAGYVHIPEIYGKNLSLGRKGRADLVIYDWYAPPVPDDAPQWVTAYMKALYMDWCNLDADAVYQWDTLIVLPPVYQNGPPVLHGSFSFDYEMQNYYLLIIDDEMVKLEASYPAGGYPGSIFYLDEAGRVFYRYGAGFITGTETWYRVWPSGFERLYGEGIVDYDAKVERVTWEVEGIQFSDTTFKSTAYQQWRSERIDRLLGSRGFVGELRELMADTQWSLPPEPEDSFFSQMGGRIYYFNEEEMTLAEYEVALAKALCDYAAFMGQM